GAPATAQHDTPMFDAARLTIGVWGGWIVLTAACLDTLTEAAGDLLSLTRVALAMGDAGELPTWLAAIHSRFHTPHHAVLALGLIAALLALLVDLRPVLAAANAFTLTWFSVIHVDALQLPGRQRFISSLVSWLGL